MNWLWYLALVLEKSGWKSRCLPTNGLTPNELMV
jgi:hypothetical protein